MSSLSPSSDSPALSPALTVTVLGCGTSTGVPMIGCDCVTCTSTDPRDKRMRASIIVSTGADSAGQGNLLIDTTPEMRIQMLRAGVGCIEAALVTHTHADHVFGMDDIRQFNYRMGNIPIPILSEAATLDHLRTIFSYAFKETQAGGGKPKLDLTEIAPYRPFDLAGVTVTPLRVYHGKMPILAYKFGERFAYLTDVSSIPDETLPHLMGLDALIIGAVRHQPHSTHFSVGQAVEVARRVGAKRAFLTHLSHDILYERDAPELPPFARYAHDGLQFTISAVPPSAHGTT